MPILLRPPPKSLKEEELKNTYNFVVEKGKCRGTDCKRFPPHSMRVAAPMIPTAIVHRQGSGHPRIKQDDKNVLTES